VLGGVCPLALTRCLIVSVVHISDTEEAVGAGVKAKKGNECWGI
jgi:hypothetical protein